MNKKTCFNCKEKKDYSLTYYTDNSVYVCKDCVSKFGGISGTMNHLYEIFESTNVGETDLIDYEY